MHPPWRLLLARPGPPEAGDARPHSEQSAAGGMGRVCSAGKRKEVWACGVGKETGGCGWIGQWIRL